VKHIHIYIMAEVRHLGFFQFKPEVTQDQLDAAFKEFLAMVSIPGLQKIEYGEHNSDEGLDDGFTHAFCMTFDSAEARDAYLPHPEHLKRVDIFQELLERVTVVDFELKGEKTAVSV